jgi:dethiobiotin synthetase
MKGIFITGTDTGAGKTIISGLLGRYLSDRGYSVITQKWIQTGVKRFSSDIDLHLKLMKKRRKDIKDYLTYISSYTFRFASSPHLAASLEKRAIRIERIKKSFKFLSEKFDFVIVEGVGGVLVPFDRKRFVIDIAKELTLPVLIVAANRLGTINHTILTIEAIRRRNMDIIGIVFNNQHLHTDKIILEDNPQIIKILTNEIILGTLPHSEDKDYLYKVFTPIGKKILSRLNKI